MNRRELFRRLGGRKPSMLPPGSVSEYLFAEKCNGCGACVEACPENIIKITPGQKPVISFARGGCTFCGDCGQSCERGAIVANIDLEQSWLWRAEISDQCLDKVGVVCRACEAFCDEDAIRFRPALGGKSDVFILSDACTGCGACVGSCPRKAIAMKIPETQSISLTKEAVA